MGKILVFTTLLFFKLYIPICFSQVNQLDITGNWCEFDSFLPYIQTSEPGVKRNEVRNTFPNSVCLDLLINPSASFRNIAIIIKKIKKRTLQGV